MHVLGIDPGVIRPGFAIVRKASPSFDLLSAGSLQLNSKEPLSYRLHYMYDFFEKQIVDHSVRALSLETPFLGKNAQNFLKLGYVRGILYLLVSKYSLQLYEFSPRQVKATVTGYGNSDKDQVARALSKFFSVFSLDGFKNYDITDAIAISFCGALHLP